MSIATTNRTLVFTTLLAAGLFASSLHAENLKGKILDPDGKAVPGARVHLFDRKTGEERSTTGKSDGSYSFPGIPAGEYLIESDGSRGALSGSANVSVSGDQTLDLKLIITGSSTQILVTASAVPLSIEEVAKVIDAIDADEIARRNEFSLAEAVRTLPGIRVKTLEGPGSFTKIQTRGLRPQDTAILIDGVRFRDAGSPQNDATAFLGEMVLSDTDRIEFLRGSGSSLYGSNALGGVLNITSRGGGGPMHSDFRFEGGGLGLVRGVAGASGGVFSDKLSYSGTASHLYATNGVRDGLPYRNSSAQGTAKFSFAPGISLTAREWYSTDYVVTTENPRAFPLVSFPPFGAIAREVQAIPLPTDQLKLYERGQPYTVGNATYLPNTIDPDGRKFGKFSNAILVFQQQVTPDTSYRVGYQSLDTRRIYLDGPQGKGQFDAFATPRSTFDGDVDTLQTRFDQRAGQHNRITFGYEYERERYFSYDGEHQPIKSLVNALQSGNTLTGISNGILLKQRSHAFYAQDQISLLNGQLQLTAAARAQTFGLEQPKFQGFSETAYSGKLSAIAVPTAYTGDGAVAYFIRRSGTKLRSHVGNSFRAPSGYERFGGGFGSYYGDPRLAPERSVAVDAGIDQWLFGSKVQISGTWFYTNLQETILFANSFAAGADPFGRTYGGYANGGGGTARGLELSGSISPRTSTKIRTAYTYVNSDSRTPTSGPNYHSVLDLPAHAFTVMATQWLGTRTDITFDLAAYSDYVATLSGSVNRFRFNGPIKPDVVVTHRLPFGDEHKLEIYGKVENMFGQRAYESGFIGPGAWFISGFRINY